MKLTRWIILMGLMAWSLLAFTSCSDEDGYDLGNFTVEVLTVVPEGNTYYLLRDNGETLWPFASNEMDYVPSHTRASVNYTLLSDSIPGFSHGIKVNWIENILTKNIARYEGAANDSIYGTDPVQIEAIGIGGGYLNVCFGANFGNRGIAHYINLVPVAEKDSLPYVLEFRHNAYDDDALYSARGLVAFDLASLPDTGGEDVTLTVRVHTFEGEKEYTLPYNSRPASQGDFSIDNYEPGINNSWK
ncbi:hypothetical protein B5F77_01010 [Parabacteroides sp. An277]|uniref:NigD-like protein n=1 Tax=Parabacteroides sp. An277 TaxID=1965619 RepID=UPI000B383FE9|nr:NigD-like protein [Parabacteroides sp. An277]OUO55465.1 hypothetical protein B5F77_01010 [Parabacteroides sp. An277]